MRGDETWINYIENYPYPYVVARTAWEIPSQLPDDWQGQHLHGVYNPQTAADMRAALDATARKKGLFTQTFHPHAWIRNDQLIDLVDHAVETYGDHVRFLNFREVRDRLNTNLLAGQPLRHPGNGQDNGVRLIDLNNDGYLDVVIGNENLKRTRIWQGETNRWRETDFPAAIVGIAANGDRPDAGVRFGIVQAECEAEAGRLCGDDCEQ